MEKKEHDNPRNKEPYKREKLTPQRVHRILEKKKLEDEEMRQIEP